MPVLGRLNGLKLSNFSYSCTERICTGIILKQAPTCKLLIKILWNGFLPSHFYKRNKTRMEKSILSDVRILSPPSKISNPHNFVNIVN